MTAIRRILCPVDFSDFSRRALRHAATLAHWYGAEVHALHVVAGLPTIWTVAPTLGPHAPEPVIDRVQRQLELLVSAIVTNGVPATTHLREGDVTREILDYARRSGVDLIVLGTHGRGGFERVVLGSVAEKVLRKSTCPVMTVSHTDELSRADRPPFKRILCPVDFAPASQRAVSYALSLAREADAELTLLHVVEPVEHRLLNEHAPTSPEAYCRFVESQMKARLATVVPADASEWCRPREIVTWGKPWEQILSVAADVKAELVVMGLHSRGALDLMLFGSTTHQVVRYVGCPVLTIGSRPAGATLRETAAADETMVAR
jgi:nucleotide-binding universal stress UspA family protein